MPSRRRFLGQSLAFSSIWASGRHLFGAGDANAVEARMRSRDTAPDVLRGADSPFTLGVASGDPWADSVVLELPDVVVLAEPPPQPARARHRAVRTVSRGSRRHPRHRRPR